MNWNACVDIKANGNFANANWEEMKQWPEVDQIWSTQGEWDFWVKLKPSVQSMEEVEKFVFNLRSKSWASETRTWWTKQI